MDQVRKCLSWFYGDCPAGRAWHKTLKSTLHSADEAPTATERCVFVHDAAIEPTHNAITAAVVDDINNLATCPELHTKLHDALERDFEMKRDDAGFILGYQCSRIAGGDKPARTSHLDALQQPQPNTSSSSNSNSSSESRQSHRQSGKYDPTQVRAIRPNRTRSDGTSRNTPRRQQILPRHAASCKTTIRGYHHLAETTQQLAPPPRRKQPRNKRRVRGLSSPLDSSHVTVAGVAGPTPTRALRSARQRESERDARNNTRRGSGGCVRGSL